MHNLDYYHTKTLGTFVIYLFSFFVNESAMFIIFAKEFSANGWLLGGKVHRLELVTSRLRLSDVVHLTIYDHT